MLTDIYCTVVCAVCTVQEPTQYKYRTYDVPDLFILRKAREQHTKHPSGPWESYTEMYVERFRFWKSFEAKVMMNSSGIFQSLGEVFGGRC